MDSAIAVFSGELIKVCFLFSLMQKRFYLDSCIWLDFFEDRSDSLKPLGEFAFMFLKKCLNEKNPVIVSDIVTKELQLFLPDAHIQERMDVFSEIIVKVEHSKSQAEEAKALWKKLDAKFPFFDILHAIIARDANAILVSRDRHFEKLGIAEFNAPEELL